MFNFTSLDVVENGVIILDSELKVHFWNKWLVINSLIDKELIENHLLTDIFKDISFKSLKRKIKISLKLKRATFLDAKNSKYLIPIKRENITNSIFDFMQQNIIIKPFDDNLVIILLHDVTPLLDAEYLINKQLEIFEKLATIDTLTKIYNRQKFNDILGAEIKRANRYKRNLSLIIFDIDHFKLVNDTYGHLTGDEVLKSITSIAKESIRESDFLARWGGEEFTILLTETNIDGAVVLAEKLRVIIAENIYGDVGHKTCSFGVSEYHGGESNDFIKDADSALYFIKENGRNGVGIHDGENYIRI